LELIIGSKHNPIDHILFDRKWYSSVRDIQLLRAAHCVMDHYLVVAIFRERLAVHKLGIYRLPIKRFNIKKLKKECKKQ
jgi:hypothetical protein